MSEQKSNKRLTIQFIALLLLLVVSPIGTYFWMKGGFEYRIERLSQLKDLGQVTAFETVDANGEPFGLEDIKDKMTLVAFLPEQQEAALKLMQRIEMVEHQMEEQLDKRKDVLFLIHCATDSLTSLSSIRNSVVRNENDKFVFVTASNEELARLSAEVYKLPFEGDENYLNTNRLTLVDLMSTIRTYYDAMDNKAMGQLVEHMAIILPPEEEKDIVFKREKEK